ncbi:MAG: WGR domain-containing protein [Luteolibacter sp.]|uniref:ATP-dependent DNA ligase n=1 Tax=Luteolibacter sp. TaxID=1962973 RepID=UPI0032665F12
MNTAPGIQSTSLHFREGSSDKVYQAAIEPKDDGYIVTFAYGRRGNTLTTGTKTPHIVTLQQAQAIYGKLVASKTSKGYKPDGESATPYQQTGREGEDSGIRCQLLNPVDESELQRLLTGTSHCLQEKFDGRRLMIRKQGDTITGINRRGIVVAIPEPIRLAVSLIPYDVLIDGEAVGDTLHAFDLLELDGHDLRERRYIDRHAGLLVTIPQNQSALRWVSTSIDPNDKVESYEESRQTNREGVVFKEVDAPYNPGRPNSGGPQLKFKFVESASFVVIAINSKRSVTLGLYDGDDLISAGNVTIPPNHEIPLLGTVVEVRYLYAFLESGSIYQPVYQGKRHDIPASECATDQLKYKVEAKAA